VNTYTVNVADILEVLGASTVVDGSFELERLQVGAEEFVLREPVRFSVTLTNTGTSVIGMGRVVAAVSATCSRCLCEFPTEIDAEVDGFYVRPGAEEGVPEEQEVEYIDGEGIIDILPSMMAALVLEAPFAPLHDEECAGLCVSCGADLNEGPCGCDADTEVAGPFAALKTLLPPDSES
jgi:uncharacterized protein